MQDIDWIKIKTEMFNDQKIKLIESLPSGAEMILVWIKLLCLAGKTNDSGLIYLSRTIPYTPEMLATLWNQDVKIIRLAIQTFTNFEMIETGENGVIMISNWEKHQNVDGLKKVQEQRRLRARKFRQKQKQKQLGFGQKNDRNVTHNVSVTQNNATEEEEETEEETEREEEVVETSSSPNENNFENIKIQNQKLNAAAENLQNRKYKNWVAKISADYPLLEQIIRESSRKGKALQTQDIENLLIEFLNFKNSIEDLNHKNYKDFKTNFLFWIPKNLQKLKNDNGNHKNTKHPQLINETTARNVFEQLDAEGF